jgi:hypothetical protein
LEQNPRALSVERGHESSLGWMSGSSQMQELERRLLELQSSGSQGIDLDRAGLRWMLVLGLVVPIILLIIGWFA